MEFVQPSPSPLADHQEATAEPVSAAPELDPRERAVLQALRQRRTALARQANVPLYWIASNATLAHLVAVRPASLAGLSRVQGFGPVRCERYGQAFLEELQSAATAQGLSVADPLGPIASPSSAKLPAKWRSRARELFEAGSPLAEVCLRCDVRPSAALEELLAVLRDNAAADLEPWVPESQRQEVLKVAAVLGWERLAPLYQALGERMSYPVLRLCRGHACGPTQPWE